MMRAMKGMMPGGLPGRPAALRRRTHGDILVAFGRAGRSRGGATCSGTLWPA